MPSDALLTCVRALEERMGSQSARQPSVEQRRELYRSMRPGATPDADTRYEATDIGGIGAEWVWVPGVSRDRTILYVHGGGFVAGAPPAFRRLAGRLSRACGASVAVLDYRLAPEYPFPAALNDTIAGYLGLVGGAGADTEIVVGGDSAGGALAISAVVALRERGVRLPSAMFALSPAADLSLSSPSVHDPDFPDPLIPAGSDDLRETYAWYLAGHDARDPHVSPVYADLTGLPPLHVEVGGAERLIDDSRRLVARATECGVPATLAVTGAAMRNFLLAAPDTPEMFAAIERVAAHITRTSNLSTQKGTDQLPSQTTHRY